MLSLTPFSNIPLQQIVSQLRCLPSAEFYVNGPLYSVKTGGLESL